MRRAEFNPTSFTPSPEAKPLVDRAVAIVAAGKRVPPGYHGRLLANFAAAWELGMAWRVPPDLKAEWDEVMLAWAEQGGETAWWDASEVRVEQPASLPTCPWAQAWRETNVEAETAMGYQPAPGLPAKFARIWLRRADQLRDRYPGQDDASINLAALNDVCRDTSEVGTHARRVRAGWLRTEERKGRRPAA